MFDSHENFWPMQEHEFVGIGLSSLFLAVVFGIIGIVLHITYRPVFQWTSSWVTMKVEWLLGVLILYFIIALLLFPVQFLSHFWEALPPIVSYEANTEVEQDV